LGRCSGRKCGDDFIGNEAPLAARWHTGIAGVVAAAATATSTAAALAPTAWRARSLRLELGLDHCLSVAGRRRSLLQQSATEADREARANADARAAHTTAPHAATAHAAATHAAALRYRGPSAADAKCGRQQGREDRNRYGVRMFVSHATSCRLRPNASRR